MTLAGDFERELHQGFNDASNVAFVSRELDGSDVAACNFSKRPVLKEPLGSKLAAEWERIAAAFGLRDHCP